MKTQVSCQDIRAKLESAIDRFKEAIGYRGTFSISEPYYPYEDPDGDQRYPWPDDAGCYVYANGAGSILYVGKGSRYMGTRIWAPIGRRGKPEEEVYPNAKEWMKNHAPHVGVWAIKVPAEHWWLATALEGYLIETLNPSENKRKR